MSALRYLALMSLTKRVCPAAASATLEVAMYCRDPALLAGPTSRLNLYRSIGGTCIRLLLLSLVVLIVSLNVFPAASRRTPPVVGYSVIAALGALLFTWFGLSRAFQSGALKCPCCGEPFARRRVGVFWLTFPRRCANCEYDLVSGHRRGDF